LTELIEFSNITEQNETPRSSANDEKLKSVGGKVEIATDDEHTIDLLKENLAKLVSGESKLELVSIKKITKQTVAGTRYEILGTFKMGDKTSECNVVCWNRPWLQDVNEKVKIKADCDGEAISSKGDSEW
jgi:hypothetical protein